MNNNYKIPKNIILVNIFIIFILKRVQITGNSIKLRRSLGNSSSAQDDAFGFGSDKLLLIFKAHSRVEFAIRKKTREYLFGYLIKIQVMKKLKRDDFIQTPNRTSSDFPQPPSDPRLACQPTSRFLSFTLNFTSFSILLLLFFVFVGWVSEFVGHRL